MDADAQGFVPAGALAVEFVGGHPGSWLITGGHRRRVRALLQAAGVPPWQRDSYPVLVDGEGVAALPGIAHRDALTGEGRYGAQWRQFEAFR